MRNWPNFRFRRVVREMGKLLLDKMSYLEKNERDGCWACYIYQTGIQRIITPSSYRSLSVIRQLVDQLQKAGAGQDRKNK